MPPAPVCAPPPPPMTLSRAPRSATSRPAAAQLPPAGRETDRHLGTPAGQVAGPAGTPSAVLSDRLSAKEATPAAQPLASQERAHISRSETQEVPVSHELKSGSHAARRQRQEHTEVHRCGGCDDTGHAKSASTAQPLLQPDEHTTTSTGNALLAQLVAAEMAAHLEMQVCPC